jgi:hypothetical protein
LIFLLCSMDSGLRRNEERFKLHTRPLVRPDVNFDFPAVLNGFRPTPE